MMSLAAAPFRHHPCGKQRLSDCAARFDRKGEVPLGARQDSCSAAPGSEAPALFGRAGCARRKARGGGAAGAGGRRLRISPAGIVRLRHRRPAGVRGRRRPSGERRRLPRPGCAFQASPNQTPDRDFYLLRKLLNLIPEDGFRANTVFASLFLLAGPMPLSYMPLVVPAAGSNKVPAEAGAPDRLCQVAARPFLVGMAVLGDFEFPSLRRSAAARAGSRPPAEEGGRGELPRSRAHRLPPSGGAEGLGAEAGRALAGRQPGWPGRPPAEGRSGATSPSASRRAGSSTPRSWT